MQNRNTTIRNVKTANPSISEDTPLNSQVSSSIKNNQSFSPFLVHYSVSTFSASDWIPRFYFIFCVTFSTNIYHWLLLWRLNVLLGVHCQPLKSQTQILHYLKRASHKSIWAHFSQEKLKRSQSLICSFPQILQVSSTKRIHTSIERLPETGHNNYSIHDRPL